MHPAPAHEPASARETGPAPLPHLPGANAGRTANRLIALTIFLPTLGLLIVAASLSPSATGHGTHTQLGLAPCGFLAATGFPCATCGMTTAFALAADGRLVSAWLNQPAGAVLALLTAMAAVTAGWSLISGMDLAPLGKALWRPAVVIALIGLILAGWVFTASRVALAG